MNVKFWNKIKSLAVNKIADDYLKKHGCDSCCPNCNQWESAGNKITTEPLEDGSDKRVCGACGHSWLAIFTPAGFVPVSECK